MQSINITSPGNYVVFIDDVNGSWKFLNAYINHLNIYTPWFKDFNPSTPSIILLLIDYWLNIYFESFIIII